MAWTSIIMIGYYGPKWEFLELLAFSFLLAALTF